MAAPWIANLVEPMLEEPEKAAGWASFAFGFGVALFTAIATGATASTRLICSTALITSIFGGEVIGAGPCITAASVAVLSAAIAGGIGSYGASTGWRVKGVGGEVGSRTVFEPIIDTFFGLSHNYDAETHALLTETHGDMLASHNMTIISVTWMETLENYNHTGGALEALDMSQGRILTLSDNGVIRTALGQTTMMGSILDSFNDFKVTNGSTNPFDKRDINVNWVSFNTYGENLKEANGYRGNVGDVEYGVVQNAQGSADNTFDTEFAQSFTGEYHSKFCLGASPSGSGIGESHWSSGRYT